MKILKPILKMLSIGGLSLDYQRSKLQTILYIIFNCCMIVFNVETVMKFTFISVFLCSLTCNVNK